MTENNPNVGSVRELHTKVIDLITSRPATATVSLGGSESDSVLEALFRATVVEQNMLALQSGSWPTEAKTVDSLKQAGTVLMSARAEQEESVVVQFMDALVHAHLGDGRVVAVAASQTSQAAERALDIVRERLPEKVSSQDGSIRVAFHSESGSLFRTILVPKWDDIRENYTGETKQRLQELIAATEGRGGQLLVWHGQPGTGKTYALRALGWEWRSWCDLHYITDPEAFFGDATYMFRTLTSRYSGSDETRWRLLIAEDTGELLSKDAKAQTGQGLSRLLNVVDGLLGQGLRVIVLITTNDPLSGMHPAVIRPGRASAPIEFQPFSVDEANAWLERHGRPPIASHRSHTLAELYSGTAALEQPTIGFAA